MLASDHLGFKVYSISKFVENYWHLLRTDSTKFFSIRVVRLAYVCTRVFFSNKRAQNGGWNVRSWDLRTENCRARAPTNNFDTRTEIKIVGSVTGCSCLRASTTQPESVWFDKTKNGEPHRRMKISIFVWCPTNVLAVLPQFFRTAVLVQMSPSKWMNPSVTPIHFWKARIGSKFFAQLRTKIRCNHFSGTSAFKRTEMKVVLFPIVCRPMTIGLRMKKGAPRDSNFSHLEQLGHCYDMKNLLSEKNENLFFESDKNGRPSPFIFARQKMLFFFCPITFGQTLGEDWEVITIDNLYSII